MSVLRMVYLALAVVGALFPFVLGAPADVTPLKMLLSIDQGTLVNWNSVIITITISIWLLAEVYDRKNWPALAALPVAWAIGPACGLPLYLFLRTASFR